MEDLVATEEVSLLALFEKLHLAHVILAQSLFPPGIDPCDFNLATIQQYFQHLDRLSKGSFIQSELRDVRVRHILADKLGMQSVREILTSPAAHSFASACIAAVALFSATTGDPSLAFVYSPGPANPSTSSIGFPRLVRPRIGKYALR